MKQQELSLHAIHRQADRLMVAILWLMVLAAFGLASRHDTLHWAIVAGAGPAALCTALAWWYPGSFGTRLAIAAALMVLNALHIHQSGGMDEAHFGIFVMLAFLLCYRDWRVILAAAAVIAVHHVSFNWLQQLAYGVRCFTQPGWDVVFIHAGYVVLESAVLCFLAMRLKGEAAQAAELHAAVAAITGGAGGAVDLRPLALPAVSPAGQALEHGVASLRSSTANVVSGLAGVHAAADAIAAANAEAMRSADEQSEQVSRTAVTMQALAAGIGANTVDAREASGYALSASAVAGAGRQVVDEVQSVMGGISASSRKIEEIIAVIDGIAFQTNILALNAAVEAARAGEQGRGFAVVASEVRQLAQRSATAAREIKDVIVTSVDQVAAGAALVDRTGTTMRDIVDGIDRVAQAMDHIVDASARQRDEIAAVEGNLAEMRRGAGRNASAIATTQDSVQALHATADSLTASLRNVQV